MRSGVSKPMVYEYFGSKEGIYLACVAEAEKGLIESMERAVSAETAPDRQLWAGATAFFTFVEEQREAWSVLFEEAPSKDGAFAEAATRIRRRQAQVIGAAHEHVGASRRGRTSSPTRSTRSPTRWSAPARRWRCGGASTPRSSATSSCCGS